MIHHLVGGLSIKDGGDVWGRWNGSNSRKPCRKIWYDRESQDAFALWSQQKVAQGIKNGFFDDEITQLPFPKGKKIQYNFLRMSFLDPILLWNH